MENLKTEPMFITNEQIKKVLGISNSSLQRLTHNQGMPPVIDGMKGKRPYAAFKDWAIHLGMIKPNQDIPLE
jgi:hypothetical protein